MRTFIVYLSIAALLMCPYGCAVRWAAAQSLGSENSVCCEECRACKLSETPPLGSDRDPAQPVPSEDGKSCLCEGAVFDATARSPADSVLEFSLLPWVTGAAVPPPLASFAPRVDRAGQPPNECSGKCARIEICSLLL